MRRRACRALGVNRFQEPGVARSQAQEGSQGQAWLSVRAGATGASEQERQDPGGAEESANASWLACLLPTVLNPAATFRPPIMPVSGGAGLPLSLSPAYCFHGISDEQFEVGHALCAALFDGDSELTTGLASANCQGGLGYSRRTPGYTLAPRGLLITTLTGRGAALRTRPRLARKVIGSLGRGVVGTRRMCATQLGPPHRHRECRFHGYRRQRSGHRDQTRLCARHGRPWPPLLVQA